MIHTPKHGSWLNIAEIELAAMEKQCLDERVSDLETLRQKVDAWAQDRDHLQVKVD
jgi:hypothetical protein